MVNGFVKLRKGRCGHVAAATQLTRGLCPGCVKRHTERRAAAARVTLGVAVGLATPPARRKPTPEAAARVAAVMRGGPRPAPARDRKADKRLRDRETRAKMRGKDLGGPTDGRQGKKQKK